MLLMLDGLIVFVICKINYDDDELMMMMMMNDDV